MSDQIPGPEVKGMIVVDDWVDESVLGAWHFATPEEVVALVRRGVESGTIKGEIQRAERGPDGFVRMIGSVKMDGNGPGTYIVIGPVSDGGSET